MYVSKANIYSDKFLRNCTLDSGCRIYRYNLEYRFELLAEMEEIASPQLSLWTKLELVFKRHGLCALGDIAEMVAKFGRVSGMEICEVMHEAARARVLEFLNYDEDDMLVECGRWITHLTKLRMGLAEAADSYADLDIELRLPRRDIIALFNGESKWVILILLLLYLQKNVVSILINCKIDLKMF